MVTSPWLRTEIEQQRQRNQVLSVVLGTVAVLNAGLIVGIVGAMSPGLGLVCLLVVVLWVVVSYFVFNSTVLRSTRARPLRPDEQHRLRPQIARLAERLHIPHPTVCAIDDDAANAFAVGTGTRATVVYTTGLLALLDDGELEGVSAHELSHLANGDTRIALYSAALLGWAIFISTVATILAVGVILMGIGLLTHRGEDDDWTTALATLCTGLLVIAATASAWIASQIWFLVSQFTHMAIFRQREWLADATAVQVTGRPLALARALEKAAATEVELAHGGRLAHALTIFGSRRDSWWGNLFKTHPDLEERITRLRQYAGLS